MKMTKKTAWPEHYRMWDWIVRQLKAGTEKPLEDIKHWYLRHEAPRKDYLRNDCYLCHMHLKFDPFRSCGRCPLRGYGDQSCYHHGHVFKDLLRAQERGWREIAIQLAETIRDAVLGKGVEI